MPHPRARSWGTDEAVTRLFAAHYRPLVRLATLLLHDAGAAEEIVQDAYVALHGRWWRLRNADSALGYLRTTVDYGSAWPASAGVRGVRVTGDTAVVDLSGAAVNSAGDDEARQAVQQLVWTVTAVAGVSGVQLRLDGTPVERLWGRVDVRGTLRRARSTGRASGARSKCTSRGSSPRPPSTCGSGRAAGRSPIRC